MPQKILVTSALPYANGPIHLGHLAGAYLPADIFVRYHRLKKNDVVYICGSDEHGVPILLRARAEGVSPQEVVDRYHAVIKKSFADFGMSFDYYGRTSSPVHHQLSQDFFRELAAKNTFRLKTDKQLYDPEAGIFLADRFIRGTCPVCKYEDAYGDQCEKCGTSLSPRDLLNPRSAITSAVPVDKETTHWYLPLDKFQPELEKWIAGHPEWKTNVLGQIQSWFKDGLKDRAVTRDLTWGVPVPDGSGQDTAGKVLYVWFDAPIGYISATKEWAQEKGEPGLWENYWKDPETRLIHFIGKDNIVFHCLIFPAMLMAHGDYVLPQNVPANEFLNLEGNKLSTSRNYAVWLDEYLQKFEPDALRYVLAANLPETRDADFSWKEFQARHNNELADILGNFINRTMTFAHSYFEGKVPAAQAADAADRDLLQRLAEAPARLEKLIDNFQFKHYVREFMDLARSANKYFNDKEPWKTRKSDPPTCAATIHYSLQLARSLAVLGAPLLPFTSRKILDMLGVDQMPEWDQSGQPGLSAGQVLGETKILFGKIEDDLMEQEIKKLQTTAPAAPVAEAEPENLISLDDVRRLELQVAEVIAAEAVEKSNKLLRLQLKIGVEQRQIVAGIAQHYPPAELIGKKVIVVVNLQPATIRGVQSQGMLLAASDGEKLAVLTVDRDINSGSRIS